MTGLGGCVPAAAGALVDAAGGFEPHAASSQPQAAASERHAVFTKCRRVRCIRRQSRPIEAKLRENTRMSASGIVRRFHNAAAAREALLVGRGRLAVDPEALPASVRSGIRETFGADLGAEEVVRRIVEEVRARGDAALRHYTRAFDRVEADVLKVTDA